MREFCGRFEFRIFLLPRCSLVQMMKNDGSLAPVTIPLRAGHVILQNSTDHKIASLTPIFARPATLTLMEQYGLVTTRSTCHGMGINMCYRIPACMHTVGNAARMNAKYKISRRSYFRLLVTLNRQRRSNNRILKLKSQVQFTIIHKMCRRHKTRGTQGVPRGSKHSYSAWSVFTVSQFSQHSSSN